MKASFGSRLASYIIDFFIINILISVICYALPTKENNIENDLSNLTNQLISGEITSNEYIEEYKDLLYENNKNNVNSNIVNLVLAVAYFAIFQYMNKGQTIGKKLLSIRVVDKDSKEPINVGKGLLRTIIIQNIISLFIAIALIGINKNIYTTTYLTITEVEGILVLISAIFVLYRKDGRGLHDMIANTMVIKEER